ncbi:MAG: hypothetical protein LWX83_15065 [Anaerolineae bacterium]|nr:hypothetical protein [Anaerolineae bacterium]
MKRVDLQNVKGKSIVMVDLSNLSGKDVSEVLSDAKNVISRLGEKKALVLTDVTGAKYDKEVAEAIKDFTKFNTPYIKGSAVVGAIGVQSVLLQTVVFLTRREIKTFTNRGEAVDWLANL